MFWKNNRNQKHFMRFGEIGSGDILGLTRSGRFFSIEVKRPGNKPTDDQVRFMEDVKRNNGIAFVATCLEDIEQSELFS